jgi:hypothetical protein
VQRLRFAVPTTTASSSGALPEPQLHEPQYGQDGRAPRTGQQQPKEVLTSDYGRQRFSDSSCSTGSRRSYPHRLHTCAVVPRVAARAHLSTLRRAGGQSLCRARLYTATSARRGCWTASGSTGAWVGVLGHSRSFVRSIVRQCRTHCRAAQRCRGLVVADVRRDRDRSIGSRTGRR